MTKTLLTRRHFISTSLACSAALTVPSYAQEAAVIDPLAPVMVRIRNQFAAGEIHVDPNQYKLFWMLENRQAIKYSIGIGRPGLYESGEFFVGRKAEWPSWTPTPAMMQRNPAYQQWADGMPGGPNNPLGARALYLYYVGTERDSYLRIHGTNRPNTIGTAVSNGCARLINEHAIDLFDRVPVGTRVVLHPKGTA